MTKPELSLPWVAQYKPYYYELEKGKTYHWCSCGLEESFILKGDGFMWTESVKSSGADWRHHIYATQATAFSAVHRPDWHAAGGLHLSRR